MSIPEIHEQAEHKMLQSLESFKHGLTKIRTGRPSPQLLDTVHVEYYGAMLPLSQVANLSLLDARTGKRAWGPRSKKRFVNPIWASIPRARVT